MRRAIALLVLLVAAPLAGCIGTEDTTDDPNQANNVDAGPLTDVINRDPQKAAHPSFGFPTINAPTQNLTGEVPAWWTPPAAVEVPDTITGLAHETRIADEEERGAGIAIFGSLAIVPGFIDPTSIYDISDPKNPTHLADLEEPPARDVDTLAFPDGRLFAAFATDAGVVPIFNLTDPTDPEKVATIEPDRGSHNLGFVPGTPILYNSASLGGGDGSQVPGQGQEGTVIYDLSDPANPEMVTDFENGYSCHDISFFIEPSEGTYRAYCAGLQMTQIWDIQDPRDPEVIVDVPVHHGVAGAPSAGVGSVMFSHLAMTNRDGTILIVGDENGGGVAPACDAHVEGAGMSASGPTGNLWFYDVSDEEDPQLLGWISPTAHYTENPPHDDRLTEIGGAAVPAGCTAHFGHLLPEDGKLAMAFYGAGVLIIDFSDPQNPIITEQWTDNANLWDVWYYQGYLFTGDLARGMDVFTLEGETS